VDNVPFRAADPHVRPTKNICCHKAHNIIQSHQMHKPFVWDNTKNARLITERGISFDEIVYYVMNDHLVDVIPNNNQDKYPGQRIFVVNCEGYIHLVPFDESENEIQLKTIIPSRKATKQYLKGERDET
jgi:uncharacterized DUF497 family protein